ncbi:Uncharacterised protein [Raoultella terrigena]|uniref:Uncharacterized protein n=1 Tax=Raoultella terrigena TaxID=577 RepID=A0A3P8M0W7_RAOTE|nr:Uncharacterised protein [Raoultella terrigena]
MRMFNNKIISPTAYPIAALNINSIRLLKSFNQPLTGQHDFYAQLIRLK